MREQTCCITGQHLRREEDEEALKARLRRTIEGLAAQNVTHFVMGGAPGFELLAGEVVLEKRAEDPRIRLTVMLPHEDVSKGWKRCDGRGTRGCWRRPTRWFTPRTARRRGVCSRETDGW